MADATTEYDIDRNKAIAILNEGIQAKIITPNIPEDDESKIAWAKRLILEAKKAQERGSHNPAIKAVLGLAEGVTEQVEEEESVPTSPDGPYNGAYVKERIKELDIPIPDKVTSKDIGTIPRDLTQVPDHELRKLHGEWYAIYAYASWKLQLEEADLLSAETLLRHHKSNALKKVAGSDDEGKKKLASMIDAEVETLPDVSEWMGNVAKHKIMVNTLKRMTDIYQGYVDRLSREITARHNEWARSHGGKY